MVSRGEFLHFRCAAHRAEGAFEESRNAVYRCGIKGCERPARAYWYKGEQYASLPAALVVEINYDEWTPGP